jgi:magnesium transporter
VIDSKGRHDGDITLREHVVAKTETPNSEVMDRNVLKVDATSPKEEVAALIAKYNLLALPVVDARRKLLGTVTIDDVVDIMLPRGWRKRSLRSIAR